MPSVTLGFDLVNHLKELDRLNRKLDQFRSLAGLNSKCFGEICLALEELFSNIVRYGHTDSKPHQISFNLKLDGPKLTISIKDDGIPFDPNAAPSPDVKCPLDQRQVGGLGVYLVKRVMDDIRYVRCDDKNLTILKKSIDETLCMEKGASANEGKKGFKSH